MKVCKFRRYFRRHSRENETRSGAHFRVHTEDCSPVRNGRHYQSSRRDCSQPVQPRHRAGTRENHPAGIPVHRLCQRTVDRRIHKAGSDRYILDRFQRLWQFINDEFTSVEEKRFWHKGNLSVQPCCTSTCGNGRLPISCSPPSTLCVPGRKENRT